MLLVVGNDVDGCRKRSYNPLLPQFDTRTEECNTVLFPSCPVASLLLQSLSSVSPAVDLRDPVSRKSGAAFGVC